MLKSKLSEKKFREILKYFCFDETANKTSIYTKISKNTINKSKLIVARLVRLKSIGTFKLLMLKIIFLALDFIRK